MNKIIIALLFLVSSSFAELKLFLDFTLDNPGELQQLDEAIRLGNDLRNAIKILKSKSPDQKELQQLELKLKDYEDKLQKSYGLYPGLNYKMIATSGYIYNLVPKERKEEYLKKGFTVKPDSPVVVVKNSNGEDVECFKVKVRLLQKRESVIQFNSALKTAFSIKSQIASLEAQLKEKPELVNNEDIKQGMSKLKEALGSIENKMKEDFGVRNDGKYIFEPKTGAVYLALSAEDLKSLSEINKARDK